MSQARHAMGGPGRVSSLQYDSVMTSLLNVRVETGKQSCDGAGKTDGPLQGGKIEFHLDWKTPMSRTSAKKEEEFTVRRRRGEEGVEEIVKVEESARSQEDGEGDENPVKDPLRWFGVLVPPALRRSQHFFKQGEVLQLLHCGWGSNASGTQGQYVYSLCKIIHPMETDKEYPCSVPPVLRIPMQCSPSIKNTHAVFPQY